MAYLHDLDDIENILRDILSDPNRSKIFSRYLIAVIVFITFYLFVN
jgi:hypothetical protein